MRMESREGNHLDEIIWMKPSVGIRPEICFSNYPRREIVQCDGTCSAGSSLCEPSTHVKQFSFRSLRQLKNCHENRGLEMLSFSRCERCQCDASQVWAAFLGQLLSAVHSQG